MPPEISQYSYFVYISLLITVFILFLPKIVKFKKQNLRIANSLGFIMIITGMIGARLFHVFYEDWPLYHENFWRVFSVWNGGFVFYGGAISAALVCYLYLKIKKQNPWKWFDFFTPFLALIYGLGRLACFFAGCCYGKTCSLPWAIQNRHPTQLYALFWELGVFIFLFYLWKKNTLQKKPGQLFWIWILFHSIGRLIMENYRADFRGPMIYGVSISSWISLFLLVIAGIKLLFLAAPSKSETV